MIKLAVIDLDDTLAGIGEGISVEVADGLKQLEESGVKICIISGKTVFYLSGFMRQVGLKEPYLIGENGATGQLGTNLPPRKAWHYQRSEKSDSILVSLQREVEAEMGDEVWFQPDTVAVCAFPTNEKAKKKVRTMIQSRLLGLQGFQLFESADCFDILPDDINKAYGVQHLCEELKLKPEEIIVAGNSENDYAMLELTPYSIGYNLPNPSKATYTADTQADIITKIYQAITDAAEADAIAAAEAEANAEE
ncbi:MAG: HAD family hydrolase [Butyricicoccaceae bacterium]